MNGGKDIRKGLEASAAISEPGLEPANVTELIVGKLRTTRSKQVTLGEFEKSLSRGSEQSMTLYA